MLYSQNCQGFNSVNHCADGGKTQQSKNNQNKNKNKYNQDILNNK